MTIQDVNPDDIEFFTMVMNPRRFFASSSVSGVTGSVYLYPRHSIAEKELQNSPSFINTNVDDGNLTTLLNGVVMKTKGHNPSTNIKTSVLAYMSGVNEVGLSSRKWKTLQINRITPPSTLTDDTYRKLVMKDNLMPFYRATHRSYNYGITNYNTLNFFTASSVPSSSVVLFPNPSQTFFLPVSSSVLTASSVVTSNYMPTGALSFDFYINPRYTSDGPACDFKAGTLFHLSSTFAVSMITGSMRDVNGLPNGFRMLLQLSHSADVPPSKLKPIVGTNVLSGSLKGYAASNLAFLSNDNSLIRNHWHHVVIRWGTSLVNHGTGSFVIDGNEVGTFCVPLQTIQPGPVASSSYPDVMCVGNYYEGNNSGFNSLACFFATTPSTQNGLPILLADSGVTLTPDFYTFNHPLNAEVHDLLIRESYISNDDIVSGSGKGPTDLNNALFYWPPFFTEQSPYRKFFGDDGGIMQTPFQTSDGTTIDPFNVALSFGIGGHYMNLENYGYEFVVGQYPLWLQLSASTTVSTTTAMTANDFFYQFPQVRKRNVTILPCDDGNFLPNFSWLKGIATSSLKQVDDLGAPSVGLVSLSQMVPSGTLFKTVTTDSGSIMDVVAGPSPSSYGGAPGEVFTIFQRTGDPSSNEIVMFDISNMYYGNRILPGSFTMKDTNVSGTSGKVSMTFADDGNGNIYRADCATSQSTWNSAGNIFYNEGLVLLKTPLIPFFGQDQFEMSFKGEQNTHVMRLNIVVPPGTLNSSSNPAYRLVSASLDANKNDQQFVYITGMNFHDDNLNVVMKTQLAQPVVKRLGDSYMFKVKVDF